MTALRSLRDTLRTLGLVNGAAYYVSVALDRLTGGWARLVKYDLVTQPLDFPRAVPRHWGQTIQIREIFDGDPLLQEMAHSPDTMAWRFRQGARCLAALKEDRLVGFLWFVEGPYEEDEVCCTFRPQPHGYAAWDFDIYVFPRYRLGPVFSVLWAAACDALTARGHVSTASRISAFNPASLAAHRRLGALLVGKALFLRFGHVQVMFATLPPRLHVRGRKGRRPVIDVGLPG